MDRFSLSQEVQGKLLLMAIKWMGLFQIGMQFEQGHVRNRVGGTVKTTPMKYTFGLTIYQSTAPFRPNPNLLQ